MAENVLSPANDVGPFRILLAEDDFEMGQLLTWLLSEEGYQVVHCSNGRQAIQDLAGGARGGRPPFDLVISDVRMPHASGFDVLEQAQKWATPPAVILTTAFPDEETLARAERLGALSVLAKPFETDALLVKVARVAQRRHLLPTTAHQPERLARPVAPGFPVEVSFQGHEGTPAIQAFAEQMASRLNVFRDSIERARVVIAAMPKKKQRARDRYHVRVELFLVGKQTITMGSTTKPGQRNSNPYDALRTAFKLAGSQLAARIARDRRDRKDRSGTAP